MASQRSPSAPSVGSQELGSDRGDLVPVPWVSRPSWEEPASETTVAGSPLLTADGELRRRLAWAGGGDQEAETTEESLPRRGTPDTEA